MQRYDLMRPKEEKEQRHLPFVDTLCKLRLLDIIVGKTRSKCNTCQYCINAPHRMLSKLSYYQDSSPDADKIKLSNLTLQKTEVGAMDKRIEGKNS